jgi:hypothetical protein
LIAKNAFDHWADKPTIAIGAKWQARGTAALDRMIDTDPGGFVRVVAQVLPDKLEVDVKHTVSRIERVIVNRQLGRRLRPRGISGRGPGLP